MKNMKRKLILSMAILISLSGLTACSQKPFRGMPPMPVESTILESAQVMNSEIYQANLISRYSVDLQPKVSGHIDKIYVKAGDCIKKGQLLMTFSRSKQQSIVNSKRAAVSAAKAVLNSYKVQRKTLESNFDFNKQMYERYKTLYSKNTISKQDLEKYTDNYNKAKFDLELNLAQIEAQNAEIQKLNYQIKEQKVQLQFYKITAPYAGIIGDIPVKIGSYVTPSTFLLNLTQNDFLEANIGLPAEKVFDIKTGLPVEILDNKNNVVGRSKISFVSPNMDKSTQTVLVKAIIKNQKGILKADQSVKARVIYSNAAGIIAPTSSIVHFGGQDFAYIIQLKDKKSFVKQKPVKLGKLQGGKYVILSGLNIGDQIVTQGIQKLRDSAPVTIIGKGK